MVYISLPPGTSPTGVSATMADTRTGSTARRPLVDGGFDPVPLPEAVGDTISILVQLTDAGAPTGRAFLVSGDKPPVIVRTDPAAHKSDVPVNAKFVVVFREPVNIAVLNAGSIG